MKKQTTGRLVQVSNVYDAESPRLEITLSGCMAAIYGNFIGMEKTTIYLPGELQRSLDATARSEGRSKADIIRSAVEAYLSKRRTVSPRSIGAGSDTEVSGSISEDWLRKSWKTESAGKRKTSR